jgi:outer membrane protein OmpA-like peptidoglycan-associated protein
MSPSNERIAIYASLTLVLIAVAGVFVYTATVDDDDPAREAVTAEVQGEALERDGAPEGDAAREEADATPGATPSSSPTTALGADLDLDEAEPSAPPEEPVGIYRQGQIILGGSVPSEEVAAGYLRRTTAIFGPDNIIMHMAIDPRVSGETLRIDVDEQFQFAAGATDFDPRFRALLELGAVALRMLPEATLVITGHTDSVGDEGTNLALSRVRAQVVVDYMVANGLPPERVVARGVGEAEPVATNDTPEGQQANRRIEASVEGIRAE